jgi:hypothetical protein
MKISELQSFWTKGKAKPSVKKPIPTGTKFASIDGNEYEKVGNAWMIPNYDSTDPSTEGTPVDAVKAKQLDTEYWVTQANKTKVEPQYAKMGFKVNSLDPLIISYKGTDYIIGDEGEWRTTKSTKKPADQVADVLNQIADKLSGDSKTFAPEIQFLVKYNDQVQDAFKTPKGVWFVGNKQMDPVQDKQIIASLEKVAAEKA